MKRNIYKILKEYGGVWITSNVTQKKFIRKQNHKFIEVKDELSSFDILGIDKNSVDEVLDSAIVAIMKIK